MDWTNAKAVIEYTERQLQDQYNLVIHLPKNRLCPPLPNRLNYINWLNSILSVCKGDNQVKSSQKQQLSYDDIKVLDIGTGASIIYPILGYKHYNWYFLGSEIDNDSYNAARENVKRNETRLYRHIEVVQVESSQVWQNALAQHIIQPWLHKYHILGKVKVSKSLKKDSKTTKVETNPYLDYKNDINTGQIMSKVAQKNMDGYGSTSFSRDSNIMEIDSNPTSDEGNHGNEINESVSSDDDDDDEPSVAAGISCDSSSSSEQSVEIETIKNFMCFCHGKNESLYPQRKADTGNVSMTSSIISKEHHRGPIIQALLQTPSTQSIVFEAEQSFYVTSFNQSRADETTAATDLLLHFTMCNPPFYGLQEDIERNEKTVNSGSDNELRTTGGEVAFVCAMISDSIVLNTRILWYTSLVGKKSSLRLLLGILRHEGITNVRSTRLTQGKTMRWCVAWSFTKIGEHNITDADKVLAWNRLRNKIYKDQNQSFSTSSSTSLKLNPMMRMDANILAQFNNTLQLHQISRNMEFANVLQILSTCTTEEIKQYPHVFKHFNADSHFMNAIGMSFMHILTILEDRISAAIHCMNTTIDKGDDATKSVISTIDSQSHLKNCYYTVKPFHTSSGFDKELSVIDNQKKRNRNDDDSNNVSSGMCIDNGISRNFAAVANDNDILMVRYTICEVIERSDCTQNNINKSEAGSILMKCKIAITCSKFHPSSLSSSSSSSSSPNMMIAVPNEPKTPDEYHYSVQFEMKDIHHNNDILYKHFAAFLDRLQHDITRTNRRWRRLLTKV